MPFTPFARLFRSRPLFAASAIVAGLSIVDDAHADTSPYCDKVRARAASEAALLFAPSVQAQGIKFPNAGAIDTGVTAGQGYQLRAAIVWSPLDFYKGFRVVAAGEADCRAFAATMTLEELLRQGSDYGRLPALRKQGRFLESHRNEWMTIAAKTDDRFAARAISLLEANAVRARIAELARLHASVSSEMELLELRGAAQVATTISQLVEDSDARTMDYEREASHIRSLAPWHFTVTGGVTPHGAPVDYFGVVQVGFNLGAFSRNASETRYLQARSAELAKARYEARDQLRRFREELRTTAARARRELAIVNDKLTALRTAKDALENSEAPQTPHALAVVELDIVFAESERTYLSELASELQHFEEKANAR